MDEIGVFSSWEIVATKFVLASLNSWKGVIFLRTITCPMISLLLVTFNTSLLK